MVGKARDSVDEATESLSGGVRRRGRDHRHRQGASRALVSLHDEEVDTKPRLSLVSRRFEEVVSKIAVIFEQGPDGRERGLDALSDGQQSLFYFALVAAVFDMERQVVAGKVDGFHQGSAAHSGAHRSSRLRSPRTTFRPIFSRASCARSAR